MSSLAEVEELLGFLSDRRDDLRTLASQHVLSLTGTAEGAALLVRADAPEALCKCIGDIPAVSKSAVSALINLSESPKALGQMLKKNLVSGLIDGLKERECAHKRLNVMLLSNLCQATPGCSQLMSLNATDKILVGINFRRLIQWFLTPVVPATAVGTEDDVYEFCGEVLTNVTQLKEARSIVLEVERGILPALLPQLTSASVVRRRGAAGIIRNCCFAQDRVEYLTSPGLGLVTAIVLPLIGPDPFDEEEAVKMPPAWRSAGPRKVREQDARVRRSLVDCLVLLCGTLTGRTCLRDMNVYPVVKSLHVYIEDNCRGGSLALTLADGGSLSNDLDVIAGGGAGRSGGEEEPLGVDDEETVESIIKLVDFLMRPEAVEGSEEAAAVDEVAPEGTEGSDGAATGQATTSVTVSNPKVEVVSDDRPVDADDVD